MKRTFLTALTMLAFVSFNSHAQSIATKQARSEAMTKAQKALDSTDKVCGTKLTMEIDWASFESKGFGGSQKENSAVGYCEAILEGIRNICSSFGADGKASVQKSIKVAKCVFKDGVTTNDFPKSGLKLSGGILTAYFDWKTSNVAVSTKDFLAANLK